jgi:hypothetical protein
MRCRTTMTVVFMSLQLLAAVLSAQTTAPRDGAVAPTGTARIRGRVVSAETGNPLRRAQVRVSGSQGGATQMVTTDADGRYEVVNLAASRYTVTVARNGYVTLEFGQQRPFEPGKTLNVADGQVADKIDFALPRGAVIAGTLSDDTGEPVTGARVQAQRYQYAPGGQRRLVPSNMGGGPFGLVTDDLGQFRLYALLPGSYIISAAPTGGAIVIDSASLGPPAAGSAATATETNGYATTYFPGTANVDEAQSVSVELGQEATARFSMVSTRLSRVSGVVRTSQGTRPANRFTVVFRAANRFGGSNIFGINQVSPDGSFTISNVPPGDYFIDARSSSAGPPSSSAAAPADDEFAIVPVSVAGQDVAGLVIAMAPGETIAGHISFDGKAARPAQLRVSTVPADPSFPPFFYGAGGQDNGSVDASGKFQLRGIAGQVLFRAGTPGWFLKSVTMNGADITDVPFDAKSATTASGLEITLTDRQTDLSGAVKNARGEAVKDFVVAIFPAGAKEGYSAARFTRAARPDQEGRFQVKGLPPGDYVAVAVDALEQNGEWDPAFQRQAKPRGTAFHLTDTQPATLDLSLIE